MTPTTAQTPEAPEAPVIPVTHVELERAWRAVQAGAFRERADVVREDRLAGPSVGPLPDPISVGTRVGFVGPVVVVVGCHGWAGTSTAALVLAEGYARCGVPVRLLDAAAAASRSGFAGAAATEHGLDETGQWRCGSRGAVAVHRITGRVTGVVDLPEPPAVAEGMVTVVDASWPVADILAAVGGHWLPRLLRQAPLLLTARASVLGLRHAEVTLGELSTASSRETPPLVLLLGARRRWPLSTTGTALLDAERDGRVHVLPEHAGLAAAGLTPAPLPRQLHPVGDRLTHLLTPTTTDATSGTTSGTTPAGRRPARPLHHLIHRKDRPS